MQTFPSHLAYFIQDGLIYILISLSIKNTLFLVFSSLNAAYIYIYIFVFNLKRFSHDRTCRIYNDVVNNFHLNASCLRKQS